MIMDASEYKLGALNAGLSPQSFTVHQNPLVNVNVSGQCFQLKRETLLTYPQTRLGKIALGKRNSIQRESGSTLCDFYDNVKDQYYFQRNPLCFSMVISYYTTEKVHIPRHTCIELFQEEIEYWGIPFKLDDCCQGYHQQEWESIEIVKKTNQIFNDRSRNKILPRDSSLGSVINLSPETKWVIWKRRIWDLFENQESSRAASIVSIVSSIMVIISTITLCVNTLPEVQVTLPNGQKADNPNILIVEIICICWFTLEYGLRAMTCPNKIEFLKSIMNAIDLLAILPFYIGIIIEHAHGAVTPPFTNVRRFVQVLRIFRIVRIFKVARHSTGLQVLGYTVRNSGSELSLLFVLLVMGMTLFSCLVYYAEEGQPGTKFTSIISSFWWAIITMTTVGYGDMYPKTVLGQMIGSLCCVSGIIFIALPIPTIVSNFSSFYKDHINKEKLNKLYVLNTTVIEDDDDCPSIIMKTDSSQSVYNVRRMSQAIVSINQLERYDNYRHRMSLINEIA